MWNKLVNGAQLAVVFHVDGSKVLHKEQTVLNEFIKQLEDIFGKQNEVLESSRLVHKYLGIVPDYSIPGKDSIYKCSNT